MSFGFSPFTYNYRAGPGAPVERQETLLLPNSTIHNRLRAQMEERGVIGATARGIGLAKIDRTGLRNGFTAIMPEDEREAKYEKAVAGVDWGDPLRGETPVLIASGLAHHWEELREIAWRAREDERMRGEFRRPGGERIDWRAINEQIAEQARNQLRGRRVYGAETRGQIGVTGF